MKYLKSVQAALRATAPWVAIPVENHAPVAIRSKLLKGALKGVTITSIEIICSGTDVSDQYAIDKWEGQPVRPETWVEKEALAGVIERICTELDVSHFSCRGYVSQSEMWEAAQRFLRYARAGQKVHVIHLGDHDPSGIDMSRDIEDRIRMFMARHGYGDEWFEFSRIALNIDQIQQYNPPPNPAKSTDSRFQGYMDEHGDESWELDALEPQVLADLIRAKVDELRDENLYAEKERREEREKGLLGKVSEKWDDVAGFVGHNEDE